MSSSYVVTGGGRGVGRAIAGRLAADGGTVVIIEMDEAALAAGRGQGGRTGGSLVNVSSHQAQRAVRGALPYATAKAAIEGLTRAAAGGRREGRPWARPRAAVRVAGTETSARSVCQQRNVPGTCLVQTGSGHDTGSVHG